MKSVIYARVSTKEQETANQLAPLTAWAKARGWPLLRIYQENESAWKSGHQAELARLLDDARRGRFQTVLVWSLDRLTREGPLAILKLIDRFKGYGIRVYSYQESWTEAPGEIADILYAITGWVARLESQRRSERTKAGIERARREGKKIGQRGPDKKKRKRRIIYESQL